MRRASCVLALVACVWIAAFAMPANAQVLYGSVTGAVTDQSGAVIPGVQLTLVNDATGFKREAATDAAGIFRLLDLPPGTYTLDALVSGFRPLKRTNIVVVIGQVNAQDLQLVVGAPNQEVTVQSSVDAHADRHRRPHLDTFAATSPDGPRWVLETAHRHLRGESRGASGPEGPRRSGHQ